ncbi:IS4 family transposase, partial [Legionella pneumophila serogroup 3]
GDGLAEAQGLLPKHAKKQVDRLLSNEAIDPVNFQCSLARFLIGNRRRIYVTIDWTVFHKDKQMTLALRLVTTHGRATPLLWETVSTKGIKGKKNDYVDMLLDRLKQIVPVACQVVLLGDREFGTLRMFEKLSKSFGFDYIFRIKRNFTITSQKKIKRLAHEWINREETISLDNPKVTTRDYLVKKVVISKQPKMKDIWCLVSSIKDIATQTVLSLYGKRWTTETSFRDEKDLQFGLGLKKTRIKTAIRRDRLLLLSAIAIIFLTLLGAASEKTGFDKYLKANTVNKRTHSLFSQGKAVLRLAVNNNNKWLAKIAECFKQILGGINSIQDDFFVI